MSEPVLHVIGWGGIESHDLYDGSFRQSLAFLTTEMTLDTLPPLRYFGVGDSYKYPANFGVVYMDFEFSKRYKDLGSITNLTEISIDLNHYRLEAGRLKSRLEAA